MSATERPLGRSGVRVPALGVGTNRWSTGEPGQARLNETLAAAVDVGMGFLDTAEIYGFGRSERRCPSGSPPASSAPRWTGRWSGSAEDRSTCTTCTSPTPCAEWRPG